MRLLWGDEEDDEPDPFAEPSFSAAEPDALRGARSASKGDGTKRARKFFDESIRRFDVTEQERDLGKKNFLEIAAEAFSPPETIERRFAKNPIEPLLTLPEIAVAAPLRAIGEALPKERPSLSDLVTGDAPKERNFLRDMRDLAISTSPGSTAMEQIGARSKLPGEKFLVPALGFAAAIGAPDPSDFLDARLVFKLPKALSGAKPRYGYGAKQFGLQFEDDLDRALYILAQPNPSKADAQYLKAAMEHTGLEEGPLRAMGRSVRARIKELAKESDEETLVIPRMTQAGPAKPLPARAIPEPAVADLPDDIDLPEVPRETPTLPPDRTIPGAVDEPPTPPRGPERPERFPGEEGVERGWFDRGRPATENIRRWGGLPGVQRGQANRVAEMFEDFEYDRGVLENESVAMVAAAEKAFKKLKPDAQRQVWTALELEMDLADPAQQKIMRVFADERDRQFRLLREVGIEPPGKRATPHIDPERSRIAALTTTAPEKARAALRKKFETHRPGQWDETDVEAAFNRLQGDHDEAMRGGKLLGSPNIRKSRSSAPIPGHLGDVFSPKWTANEAIQGWKAYTSQWARAVADAKHFGPEAETLFGKIEYQPGTSRFKGDPGLPVINPETGRYQRMKGLLDETDNQEFTDLVERHRKHMVAGGPDNAVFSTARNIEVASKLGGAWEPNSLQSAVTTFPATASVEGLLSALGTLIDGAKLAMRDPDFAKEIGAVSKQFALDTATLGQAAQGGIPGLAAKGAEFTLAKATPFQLAETVVNRQLAPAMGRVYLQKLGKSIAGGGKKAQMAEERIRKVLNGRAIAETLIERAKNGEDLLVRTPESDRFAYEVSHRTQFSANPNDLPIDVATPLGRFLFLFKNFPYQYTRFLKTDVYDPARRGDWGPFQAWALGAGLGGAAIANLREAIQPNLDEREFSANPVDIGPSGLPRLFEWYAATGGIGLALDTVTNAARAAEGTARGAIRAFGALGVPPYVTDVVSTIMEQSQQQGGLLGELAERVVPNPGRLPRAAIEFAEEHSPIPPIGFGSPEGASLSLTGGTRREKRRSPFFLDVTRDLDFSLPGFGSDDEPIFDSPDTTTAAPSGGGMRLEW